MYNVICVLRGCLAVKFDSCNILLSSIRSYYVCNLFCVCVCLKLKYTKMSSSTEPILSWNVPTIFLPPNWDVCCVWTWTGACVIAHLNPATVYTLTVPVPSLDKEEGDAIHLRYGIALLNSKYTIQASVVWTLNTKQDNKRETACPCVDIKVTGCPAFPSGRWWENSLEWDLGCWSVHSKLVIVWLDSSWDWYLTFITAWIFNPGLFILW